MYQVQRSEEWVLEFGVPGEGLDALIRTVFGSPLPVPVRRGRKEIPSTKYKERSTKKRRVWALGFTVLMEEAAAVP